MTNDKYEMWSMKCDKCNFLALQFKTCTLQPKTLNL